MTLRTDAAQFQTDVGLLHEVIHGGPQQTVATEGGNVNTLSGTLAKAAGFNPRGNYAASTAYNVLDLAVDAADAGGNGAGTVYLALSAFTSGDGTAGQTLADEIAAGKWMVHQGLTEIDKNNQLIGMVGNVQELRNFPYAMLPNNTMLQPKGNETPGDGGGGPPRYLVNSGVPGTFTHKPWSILPTGGDGSVAWVWDIRGYIDIKWCWAKGDDITDDTDRINDAQSYIEAEQIELWWSAGIYRFTSITSATPNGFSWDGAGETNVVLKGFDENSYIQVGNTAYRSNRIKMKNISIHGNNLADILFRAVRTTLDLTDVEIRYSGSSLAEFRSVYNSKMTRVRWTQDQTQPLNDVRTYDAEIAIVKDPNDDYSSNMINFSDCIWENYRQEPFLLKGTGSARTAHISFTLGKFETDQPLSIIRTETFQGLHMIGTIVQMNRSAAGDVPAIIFGTGSNGLHLADLHAFHNSSTANGSAYNKLLQIADYQVGPIFLCAVELTTDGVSATHQLIDLANGAITNLQGLSAKDVTINRRPVYNLAGVSSYNTYDINAIPGVLNIVASNAPPRFQLRRIGDVANNSTKIVGTDGIDDYDGTGIFSRVHTDGSLVECYRSFKIPGTWQNPFRMGNWCLWMTTAGDLYRKGGSDPTGETDGTKIGP